MKKEIEIEILFKLADLIFDRGAFQLGKFKTKSQDWIPYYFNLRDDSNPKKSGPLQTVDYNLIALCLNEIFLRKNLEFDAIAGIPHTGEEIVYAYFKLFKCNFIKLAKEEKENGTRKIVIHPNFTYKKDQNILLVDDVINKATSSMEAIEALNSVGAGCIVKDIAVVIDLEQGGRKNLEKEGYAVHCVFKASELLPYYFRKCLNYLEKGG